MRLSITLSRTRQGDQDYLQVLSDDQTSINLVLIADEITVHDARTPAAHKRTSRATAPTPPPPPKRTRRR